MFPSLFIHLMIIIGGLEAMLEDQQGMLRLCGCFDKKF